MAAKQEIFNPRDTVSAKQGKVYVLINGSRELWLNVKNISCKANIENADVPRLGTMVKGSKTTGMSYSGSMTIYKVHSGVDDMVQQLAETGVVPYFDIQTVVEDKTSGNGRDAKLITDCVLDGDIELVGIDADGEFIEQEVGFNASGVTYLEKLRNTTSIVGG